MAGLYYDPRIMGFGDAFSGNLVRGMTASSAMEGSELRKLQAQKLYNQLQQEDALGAMLKERAGAGAYSPQAVTHPMEVPLTEQGQNLGETAIIQTPTGEMKPATDTPWLDAYKFWAQQGNTAKAAEALQLHQADQIINTKPGREALKNIVGVLKDLKGKMTPGVAKMVQMAYADEFQKFGITPDDLMLSAKDGFNVLTKDIPGDPNRQIVVTMIDGEEKAHVSIVDKSEKNKTDNQLIAESLERDEEGKPTEKAAKAQKILSEKQKLNKEKIITSTIIKEGSDIRKEDRKEKKDEEKRTRKLDEKTAGAVIAKLPEMNQDALNQGMNIERIDKMLGLIKAGAAGKKGQVMGALAPYAEAAGYDAKKMSDAQLFQVLASTIGGSMRSQIVGPGQVSNYEQQLLKSVSGGGGTASAAAAELLNYYRKAALTKIAHYNDTIESVGEYSPAVGSIYKKVEIGGGSSAPAGIDMDAVKKELERRKSGGK